MDGENEDEMRLNLEAFFVDPAEMNQDSIPAFKHSVEMYHKKYTEANIWSNLYNQLRLGHDVELLKKIAYMIRGLNHFEDISIECVQVPVHHYPSPDPDYEYIENRDDGGGQGVVMRDDRRQSGTEQSVKRVKHEQPEQPKAKLTKMTPTLVLRDEPPHVRAMRQTIARGLTLTPHTHLGRNTSEQLSRIVRSRTYGKCINIPKLQVELYQEFERAIEHAKVNRDNDTKLLLFKQLFIKLQQIILKIYNTLIPTEPDHWEYPLSYGHPPQTYDDYNTKRNHYFDLFRRCLKLAFTLRKNGISEEKTKNIINFLFTSIFVIRSENIEKFIQFIFELLPIADEVNKLFDNANDNSENDDLKNLRKQIQEQRIIEILRPIVERFNNTNDPLLDIFRSSGIIQHQIPNSRWLQYLFQGYNSRIIPDDKFVRPPMLKPRESSLFGRGGGLGGIRKKMNHTNKSKQSKRNKQSRRNKQSKRNKQSRRNKQRS